jgi:hypothetical protein
MSKTITRNAESNTALHTEIGYKCCWSEATVQMQIIMVTPVCQIVFHSSVWNGHTVLQRHLVPHNVTLNTKRTQLIQDTTLTINFAELIQGRRQVDATILMLREQPLNYLRKQGLWERGGVVCY